MYVPEFIAGVIATLAVEFVLLIILAIVHKKKK